MEWYVKIGGQQLGPMNDDALRAMAASGKIGHDTPLWRPGLKEWVSADQVPGIIVPPNSSANSSPPPSRQSPEAITGSKPAKPKQPLIPAEPWRRFWPRMLDAFMWVPILGILLATIAPADFHNGGFFYRKSGAYLLVIFLMPGSLLLDAAVFTIFGNTFGKWLAGVKILTSSGGVVTFRRYLRRNLSLYTYGLAGGIWIAALFTLGFSYTKAKQNTLLQWDQSAGTRSMTTSTNPLRLGIVATLYIVLVILADFLHTYASLQ